MIEKIKRFFEWNKHTAVVCTRLNTGRLFIYRDRPDWYVAEMARYTTGGGPMEKLFDAARREQEKRLLNQAYGLIRKLEKQLGPLPAEPK